CDTEEHTGTNGGANLYINVASNSRFQVVGVVRTTSAGLLWVRFDIAVGTGDCVFSSHGWDDYTVPRIGG
ncbi:hypothetical protein ACWGRJ_48020, partial [Bradyrhizobium sp. Lot11]